MGNKVLFPLFGFSLIILLGFSAYSSNNSLINSNKGIVELDKSGNFLNENFLSNFKNRDLKEIPSLSIPDSTDKKKATEDTIKVKLSRSDSLKLKFTQDSLKRIEELSKDSTARLKYFKYSRNYNPILQFRPRKQSSFFIRPSEANVTRMVSMDSTGKKVVIEEKVAGQNVKPKLEIPLDDYINLRLDAIRKDSWESLGYQYVLKDNKKDLSQLITDITNIDIPLPSNPILSIFGPPKINLKIQGQVDIHGAWRNETTEGVTTSALGNTRNEPDFKQQVQINLNGTIGDKLNLGADWNTERQFQYENQLKLKYTGYEDEIVQSVEAGNVSLQTSPLVGGSEALFGVKAQFKMGPFSLTALASQKKSEVKEVSLSGGSKSNQFELHAYDYSPNHFFVDSMYQSRKLNIFNNYYGNSVPKITDSLRIKDIQVWKSTTGLVTAFERKANAYMFLGKRNEGKVYIDALRDSTLNTEPGIKEINRRFVLLTEGTDYTLHAETGFITFKTSIQDQDAIAVAYRIEGPSSLSTDDLFVGEFTKDAVGDSTSRLVLKLVKPPNLQPQFKDAWKLQLRNIYPIGGRSIKEEGFTMDIKYRVEGQEPQDNVDGIKLLQAFGFDNTDKSKTSTTPDGAFDFFAGRTIMPETGEIVFPVLEPFKRDFPTDLPQDLKFPAVYDTTSTFAKQDKTKDKFLFTGEYSADVSASFNIGFNVVENSVKVLLNGQTLSAGTDYVVDYNLGQIVIRNSNALVPGADLKITYEQNDLFTLASKTMLGLRGIYEFNKETTLGFSFLNLNQQTLSDKVRIGEEPLNNSIMGLDFKTSINLPFITKALDKLISTSAPSTLVLNGELAYINPDPNTKKSTIENDGGKSIAYIDDFEGAKRTIPLVESYGSWKDISIPVGLPYIGNMPEEDQMNYKGLTYWFNILPSNVNIKDIYGDRKQAPPDGQQITALDLVFNPAKKGYYNWNPSLGEPNKNWGGIMKGLSSTANNLVEENIEFIEFWLNIYEAPANAKITIDLGQISEDVIPNRKLDTEDKNNNDLVDEGEDIGIDGMKDTAEPNYSASNTDPSTDNYSFQLNSGDYSHINGTEGNAVSIDLGRVPDSEDLNNNKTLDRTNSFFRYEVPLDTTSLNPFLKGTGYKGWHLFRIPLKDYAKKVGDPSFSVVEFLRIWVSGVETPVHLRFAEMNMVGNQWQKVLNSKVTLEDTVMTVSTINIEDNPDYYSPPGVQRERDRSQTQYEIFKNEQSLDLIIKDLKDGDKRETVKYVTRSLDVFNYKELKFFIHGDLSEANGSVSHFIDNSNYGAEVYLRFGSDSLNYYEYRQPVKAGWNEVGMKFADLTAIKQRRPDSLKTPYLVEIADLPGHYYGILGNPTLTRVSFFTIGIENPLNKGDKNQSIRGSVWINELRVLDAESTPGWAYSTSASLKVADLLSITANAAQTNPYFHKIADRFGNREDTRNWGISVNLDVLKLIPVNLSGSNLQVSYSHTENTSNPLYLPGTDIKVEEAQVELARAMREKGYSEEQVRMSVDSLKNVSQTVGVTEIWNLSNIRFKIPTDVWYIRDIFNNLSFGFNYSKSTLRSPTIQNSLRWNWGANASYALNFSRELYFKPVDIPIIGEFFDLFSDYKDMKFYFTPQSFNTSLTLSRKRDFSATRSNSAKPSIQRDFAATRGAGFNWTFVEGGLLNLSLGYNVDIQSTLAYLLTENDIERTEGQIWRDIFGGAVFGKDFNYRQTFDLRANPRIPSLFDLNRFLSLTASYSSSYQWQNNFQQEELGRSAGYSSKLTANFSIRLKSLFAPLFTEEDSKKQQTGRPQQQKPQPPPQQGPASTGGRRSGRGADRSGLDQPPQMQLPKVGGDSTKVIPDSMNVKGIIDSTAIAKEDSVESVSPFTLTLEYLKLGAKWIFFDYDQISMNFSQSNSYTGGGIKGTGTGFNNFWGVKQSDLKGPSRLFMLGLSNNVGTRAPLGNLQDSYSHKNDLDFKTSRPLWEGAQIDIRWRVGWGVNKTVTIQTDSIGTPRISNQISTGSLDRSFLSFPTMFLNKSGIKKVHELYDPTAKDPSLSLSKAFSEGFESFALLSKLPFLAKVINYIPRPNWSFSWSGLEKLPLLDFAKRVSINHAYDSNYSEGWKINPDGNQEIQSQRVDYGFNPLVGLTFNFDQFLGGNFQSSVRYTTKTAYSLGVTTRNVTEAFNKDINFTASYSKSGFELPLFGISLKNDLEVSISYTLGQQSNILYEMDNFTDAGTPQDAKTTTTIEPKIRYVMSSRVTLSIFYKRTSIEPKGASRVPPSKTNEAGIDVRISIQQ